MDGGVHPATRLPNTCPQTERLLPLPFGVFRRPPSSSPIGKKPTGTTRKWKWKRKGEDSVQASEAVLRALERARFEIIPARNVDSEIRALPSGVRVAITCSPRRGIERGLALAEVVRRLGHPVTLHVAARLVPDRRTVGEILDRVQELGVDDLFVIGGDEDQPTGPFADALSLLQAMRDHGGLPRSIGVAAYPEGHPRIPSPNLLEALRRKQEFATYMVSQMCFRAEAIAAFLREVEGAGVHLPLVLGIPGAVAPTKLADIALRIGVGDSLRFLRRHFGLVGRIATQGAYVADELLEGLGPEFASGRVVGVHVYTFNQVHATYTWWEDTRRVWEERSASPMGRQ